MTAPLRIAAWGGWLALVTGLSACSVVLETSERQCEIDADCVARGFAQQTCVDNICIESKWECLGRITRPSETPGATHTWTGRFIDIGTRMPPPDLSAKLCANPDVNCDNPLAEGVPIASDGTVEFVVPSGFEGYVELSSMEIEPSIVSLGAAIVDDVVDSEPVELLPPGTIQTIADVLMLELDTTRGQALILNLDCASEPAAGITVSADTADDETIVLYIDTDLPDPSLDATIDTGNAGVFNIPVGFTTFANVRQETGEAIGSSVVYMRPGFITYVTLPPSVDP